MGLADQIYEANRLYSAEGEDELGLKIWDKVDYLVARTIAISRRDRISPYTTNQLHLRGDTIFYGNDPVKEDKTNIYRYSLFEGKLKPGWEVLYWLKLRQCLPTLDKDVIQISDDLFWVKSRGEVVDHEQIQEICGTL